MKRIAGVPFRTSMVNKPSLSFAMAVALSLATAGSSVLPMAHASTNDTVTAEGISLPQVPMRAVPGVRFDLWIAALAKERAPGVTAPSAQQLNKAIRNIISTGEIQKSYENLLKLALSVSLNDAKAHLVLADALFGARGALRETPFDASDERQLIDRHHRMTLLQFLGEETLYFASQKFPGQVKEYKKVYSKVPNELKSSIASSNLRGIEVMTGDVVLSKFSGTGSSSFIALSSNRPSLFSHAAAVYVDSQTGELLSPEAFIEDGVKLRPMKDSYIDNSKTRMFVYRGMGSSSEKKRANLIAAAIGVSKLVDDMHSLVADPRAQAAFPYNFTMDPESGSGGFTCTETVLEAYKRGGLTGENNAYAKSVWSSFPEKNRKVLSEFLEMKAPRFPAPGDLDMNSNFDLVGFRIDVEKLAQDRVEMAAIDAILALIEQNQGQIRDRLLVFDNIGERTVTQEQIDFIKSLEVIPEEIRNQITHNVPANINIKQLVFFGYLNQVYTPQVRDAMMKEAAAFQEAMGRPAGLNELRGLAVRHTLLHIEQIKSIAQEFAKKAGAAMGVVQ